jgi:hypothetical protein
MGNPVGVGYKAFCQSFPALQSSGCFGLYSRSTVYRYSTAQSIVVNELVDGGGCLQYYKYLSRELKQGTAFGAQKAAPVASTK